MWALTMEPAACNFYGAWNFKVSSTCSGKFVNPHRVLLNTTTNDNHSIPLNSDSRSDSHEGLFIAPVQGCVKNKIERV